VPTPARTVAFQVLLEMERPRGPTLADRLARADAEGLDTRERGFLHELVLGTLRTRGFLDHALRPSIDRPFDRIDAAALTALRLGAHQVLNLRVPDRAAVSESVDLAREAAPRAAGFVNAVLRRLVREGPPAVPDPAADPSGWLTTAGSLPPWLASRWLRELGPEAAVARARAFLERPPAAFRLNPRRPEAWAHVDADGLAPRALVVPGAWEATAGQAAALAAEGWIYVQDQGSQMAAHLAAGRGTTLDACAAPGSKSTLLGDLSPGGRVAALEVSPRRLATLQKVVREWGAGNVRPVGGDAQRPPFREALFDAVLLDAPCSGLGTLGRHPDIRWKAAEGDLLRHGRRQLELLSAVAPLVRPGGTLVYATCSLEPEETTGVVAEFLAAPGFRPGPVPEWASAFVEGPFLRTRPERDRGDGFFVAPLERATRAGLRSAGHR
jgi:16S rRNA (cytosine967-C5)-methyltransferase